MEKKFPDDLIREIAGHVDMGGICYINTDTGEIIFMQDSEALCNLGIWWDDNDKPNADWPDWQQETFAEVKADMKKINSWEHVVEIERPPSRTAYRFMERFVEEIVPEGPIKENFLKALSRSHPFRKFNVIIHSSEYREKWFKFKQTALEEYVREEIEEEGL